MHGTVFLVTLNACESATPGPDVFNNLVATLVRQRTPYALGMRMEIHDEDARTFSRKFYGELAHGSSVEEALFQARWNLVDSKQPWAIGIPVLYTSLKGAASGFKATEGMPIIQEHQSRLDLYALPRVVGTFQGRLDDLKALGTYLTGDSRPSTVTIHGGGGQGKTALAREAVERFAYAWPDGVWTTSLEHLPGRSDLAADLARFLGIATQSILDPRELECQVLDRLSLLRTLLVLDNAETLVEAVDARDSAAIALAEFLQRLPSASVSLLVTSRIPLGWNGEVSHELSGLSPPRRCRALSTERITAVTGYTYTGRSSTG
jgi:CHAT domain